MNVGDGVLNDVVGVVIQFAKYHRVGEGFGEALIIDHRAVDSKGGSALVLVVENGLGEELFESGDVLVGDVVPESGLVGLK